MSIEFLGPKSIRIGSEVLPVGETYGGKIASVSAEGACDKTFGQFLGINNLRGIKGADIPSSFTLTIYNPTATAPGFENYSPTNFEGRRTFSLMYSFDFEQWYWQKNLRHFIEELREKVRTSMPACVRTNIEAEQEYILLWLDFELEDKSDCYNEFVNANRTIHQMYVKILEATGSSVVSQPSESVIRWWLRHVIVPIASCGAVAALVSWYLLGK